MSKDEIEFVDGLIVKPPRDGAPDFVIGSLSIKREELIAWLHGRDGDWINADIKEAKSGKWYVAVNAWKPGSAGHGPARQAPAAKSAPTPAPANNDPFPDDDIPF